MGMLATVINGLALQNALESESVACSLLSAIPIPSVSEAFSRRCALHHMDKGRVVISVAGSGNPYFTTDTAAALRACELNCDLLLKATKVSGVYTADPDRHEDAEFLPALSYDDVVTKKLKVMDATAITLAYENNIPIAVFSIYENNSFYNVVQGKGAFSLIS
jgi:uridylate kinase